ncbi:MAG: trypsin-like serine protease [Chromatiales bacterium]|nr:MAG: trypsin-like serine protease [Chromatiales bacterium]
MRRLTGWLALAAGLLVWTSTLAIVHGKAVNQPRFLDEFPWAVALENPVTGGVCSAVLISPTHVLTAAHCTSAKKRLLVGNTSRRRANSVAIADAIKHPGYSRDTHQFDVGLIRLVEPVDIPPIALISESEYLLLVEEHAPAAVLGWGKRPGSHFSDRLVLAPINLHRLGVRGTQLMYEDRGAPCGGDSGGPLVVEGLDRKRVLVGVASVTDGNLCSTGGGIAVYTDIAAVRRFIEENVPDLPQ